MPSLLLPSGAVVCYDASDELLLAGHSWCECKDVRKKTSYAYTKVKNKTVYMHRMLMSAGPQQLVDHLNGNGLDNHRSNLRMATKSQNQCNRGADRTAESKYKGVNRSHGYWAARIQIDGKRKTLGSFDTEADAALAYNEAARQCHGEFAYMNPVPLPYAGYVPMQRGRG